MIKYIIKTKSEKSILDAVLNHGDPDNDTDGPFHSLESLMGFINTYENSDNKYKAYEWKEENEKVSITQIYPKNKKNKIVHSSNRFYESLKKIK